MNDAGDPMRPRILVVSASVGAGHDGAARELGRRLEARGAHVEVRDFLDALPRWVGCTIREGYTGTITYLPWFYDWLYAALERRGPVRRIALLVCAAARRSLLRWAAGADAVVSTYPLASQTLGQLVAKGKLAVPTTTFLTDPSVHALWVNRDVHRHLTTMPATAQVGELDYQTLMCVAGPLVPQRFAAQVSQERRLELRTALGLPGLAPVALVVTGSLGLGAVADTVDALVATGVVTPLVLCGRNTRLLEELRRREGVVAVGWRSDVHELMHACDVLVHNAGGLSFTESLVAGLPAVTYGCIPGHGKDNGQVLDRFGVAPLAEDVPGLRAALREQLRPEAREAVRAITAAATRDASHLVLDDVQAMAAGVRSEAHRRLRSVRRSLRRRVAAVAAMALVVVGSVGATEGVSAATEHGFDVARMPSGSATIVVAPQQLGQVSADAPLLGRLHAAVVLPSRPGGTEVTAARALASAGVLLLRRPCPPSTLLRDNRPRMCGSAATLQRHDVTTTPVEVSDDDLQALDLVLAREDRARVLLPTVKVHPERPTSPPAAHRFGGVWLVELSADPGAERRLPRMLDALARIAAARHLSLLPVTTARQEP
ncbi:MAG: MGDG synthase family glycosyltransferase [Nocardioidaceae bacterium]